MKQQSWWHRTARAAAAAGLGLCIVTAASAQSWRPEKNVEIIVGSSPGGSFDITARAMQRILQERKLVDTPVSVVNRPGGNNAVSWVYMNSHPGDAHYLALVFPTLITNRLIGTNPITVSDVTPIAHLYSDYIAFGVAPNSPLKTGRDVVEALRKNPQSISMGLTAVGTAHQVAAAHLAKAAGVNPKALKFVVFKGAGDATTAVMGGHVDVVISSPTSFVSHLEAGRLHVPFVTSPQRIGAGLSKVPTLREQGLNIVVTNWRGIAGPQGMTQPQLAFWEQTFQKLTANDEWKKELEKYGWGNHFMGSAEFRKFLDAQRDELAGLFGALGLLKQ
jgi:putative tricarboxylic transport membrane protein